MVKLPFIRAENKFLGLRQKTRFMCEIVGLDELD
jgi:hypothetical protein